MRVDPVPLPPRSHSDAFAYGYGGGTPSTLLHALLRCALGDGPDVMRAHKLAAERSPDGGAASQLWSAIATTNGPLRLSWPEVKLWARADKKRALNDPDTAVR